MKWSARSCISSNSGAKEYTLLSCMYRQTYDLGSSSQYTFGLVWISSAVSFNGGGWGDLPPHGDFPWRIGKLLRESVIAD
jgi:hypothetical protein